MAHGLVITAIEPADGRDRRVSVHVGTKAVATLSANTAERLGLAVGLPWDNALRHRVAQALRFERAMDAAARMVNRRMLSRSEIESRLARRQWPDDLRRSVLARMGELGLIDDAKLGRLLVEQVRRDRPAGADLLRAKLTARGLDEPLIEQLLAECAAGDDPLAQVRELARQRLPRLAGASPAVQRRRLAGAMMRRGFEQELIEQVIEELLGGGDGNGPAD